MIDATDPMRMMCGNCEADIKRRYRWWANQHGERSRFFCDECGCWEDRILLYGKSFKYWWVIGHAPDNATNAKTVILYTE